MKEGKYPQKENCWEMKIFSKKPWTRKPVCAAQENEANGLKSADWAGTVCASISQGLYNFLHNNNKIR